MDIRDLVKYVEAQRKQGLSDAEIKNNLIANGWELENIKSVFVQLKNKNYKESSDIPKSTKKYFLRGDFAFRTLENGLSRKDFNKNKPSLMVPAIVGTISIIFLFLSFKTNWFLIFALMGLAAGVVTYIRGNEIWGNTIFVVCLFIILSAPLIRFFMMLLGIN